MGGGDELPGPWSCGGQPVQLWRTARLCPQDCRRHRHCLRSRPRVVCSVMRACSGREIFVSDSHPPERRDAAPPQRGRREARGPFAPGASAPPRPKAGLGWKRCLRELPVGVRGSLRGALAAALPFLPPPARAPLARFLSSSNIEGRRADGSRLRARCRAAPRRHVGGAAARGCAGGAPRLARGAG